MKKEELLHTLALQHVPKVGDILAKRLIQHCGTAEAVFKSSKKALLSIEGIGESIVNELKRSEHHFAAESELHFIEDHGIQHYYFLEEAYPERLKHCIDGPILVFGRGEMHFRNHRIISIVGTRKVTSVGRQFCEHLIEAISPLNPIIVSGFAYGVDIVAQKAAVKHNLQTIGCLAHGLNQIYPKMHKKYVAAIEANGGFLTDFWSTDVFDRNNFLKRNRIIAGMTEATLVIESAEKGGSLVTADIANSYNREVFAVPGRPQDKLSAGCNDLIKQQKAHLLTSAADLVYQLGWEISKETSPIQKQLFVELDATEKKVYRFLKEEGKTLLDIIASQTDLPVYQASSILLSMELKGVVRPLPGKLYELV